MTNLTIRITSVLAALLVGVVATQAAPNAYQYDKSQLPILVDKYYEIKHPDGPVTLSRSDIEELTTQPLYRHVDNFDIPMPREQQFGF